MENLKPDNRGAALITVLVVTTFILFLATTLLYTASMNYQQKQTDYQNKQSFYGAEQALDALRALLVEDVQDAYAVAYADTASQFILLGSGDSRKANFTDCFNEELLDIWNDRLSATSDGKMSSAVQKLMEDNGTVEATRKCVYDVLTAGVYKINDDTGTAKTKKFVLRGVRVKYTYGNYTTFLYTDICMEAPTLDWSVDSSGSGTAVDRSTISFTDCISYINWQRIDYDYDQDHEYDNLEVGTEPETVTYTVP